MVSGVPILKHLRVPHIGVLKIKVSHSLLAVGAVGVRV